MIALDLRPVVPALVVAVTAAVVLLVQAFTPQDRRAPGFGLSVFGLCAALIAVLVISSSRARGRGATLAGSLSADVFALFLEAAILIIALLATLLSSGYLRASGIERGEYYSLLLFSVVGMLGLVSTLDLISLFVALEVMSVAVYALAGFQRSRPESSEAAVKYFLTGAFASAFFLYGIAILYGASGSTSLARIGMALTWRSGNGLMLPIVGVGLLLSGLGFKVASVPFHMWTPDVYEGAPTPVTAFMSAGVKVAAFGALLRILHPALLVLASDWRPALAALAILGMVVGNLAALPQSRLKRMLAYSAVAHTGYLMTALVADPGPGFTAVLFYLVAYAAVNLGAFGALGALARDRREPLTLDDLAGLGERRPFLAAIVSLFLISLIGIPVTVGFVGKFALFSAAVRAGYVGLALVGVVMSVVSASYYLRVVVFMYMREPEGEDPWSRVSVSSGIALGACVAVTLVAGVYPAPLLALARAAVEALR